MSIVPGPQAWRDAGLADVDPDGWIDLDAGAGLDTDTETDADAGARSPDRAGDVVVGEVVEANDADVVEQSIALPPGDEDEYR